MRVGMVIDLKKCIGCRTCVTVCKAANFLPPGIEWANLLEQEFGKYPKVTRVIMPLLCMHCDDPPCVKACPTGASTKRLEDGIVTIDSTKCVGCGYCMIACPYGARYLHTRRMEYFPGQGLTPFEKFGEHKHPTGVVEKCDFCLSRVKEGLKPACVDACMVQARYFGDFDDPDSEVYQLIYKRGGYQIHPELDTNPSVYYLP